MAPSPAGPLPSARRRPKLDSHCPSRLWEARFFCYNQNSVPSSRCRPPFPLLSPLLVSASTLACSRVVRACLLPLCSLLQRELSRAPLWRPRVGSPPWTPLLAKGTTKERGERGCRRLPSCSLCCGGCFFATCLCSLAIISCCGGSLDYDRSGDMFFPLLYGVDWDCKSEKKK